MTRTIVDIRKDHEEAIGNAVNTLRRIRKVPVSQDIDRAEAVTLVSNGEDIEVLLTEIDRLFGEQYGMADWAQAGIDGQAKIDGLTTQIEQLSKALRREQRAADAWRRFYREETGDAHKKDLPEKYHRYIDGKPLPTKDTDFNQSEVIKENGQKFQSESKKGGAVEWCDCAPTTCKGGEYYSCRMNSPLAKKPSTDNSALRDYIEKLEDAHDYLLDGLGEFSSDGDQIYGLDWAKIVCRADELLGAKPAVPPRPPLSNEGSDQ